jgi:hypothetical protein
MKRHPVAIWNQRHKFGGKGRNDGGNRQRPALRHPAPPGVRHCHTHRAPWQWRKKLAITQMKRLWKTGLTFTKRFATISLERASNVL